jgi:dTDP-4-dehydrorhamnose reductase
MKIIGTGLSGLVGSRIVELLPEYEFIDYSLSTGISILEKDQLAQATEKNCDFDCFIHLAAFTDTAQAWAQNGDKNSLCYQLNVEGTKNIIDLCQKYNKHLIHISTDFIFDGTKDGLYTEEDKPNPVEWYGETKYIAEQEVLNSQISSSIIRIAYPYRANFVDKKDIARKIIEALKTKSLNHPLFGDQITTPTFVDDIALGLKYFFQNKTSGIFHLVGSSSQSPFEMAQKIAEIWGFDSSLIKEGSLIDYVKSLPPGSRPWQKNLAISNKKIKSFGISTKTLEEGLTEMKRQLSLPV